MPRSIKDPPLHYGCGAFEGGGPTTPSTGHRIFRLKEHTERLVNSAKILRMKIPFSQEEVNEAQRPWSARTSWNPATSAPDLGG